MGNFHCRVVTGFSWTDTKRETGRQRKKKLSGRKCGAVLSQRKSKFSCGNCFTESYPQERVWQREESKWRLNASDAVQWRKQTSMQFVIAKFHEKHGTNSTLHGTLDRIDRNGEFDWIVTCIKNLSPENLQFFWVYGLVPLVC